MMFMPLLRALRLATAHVPVVVHAPVAVHGQVAAHAVAVVRRIAVLRAPPVAVQAPLVPTQEEARVLSLLKTIALVAAVVYAAVRAVAPVAVQRREALHALPLLRAARVVVPEGDRRV